MSYKYKLYGAILGDLAGQPYEFKYKGDYSEFNLHDKRSHFTDDTIMTLATAKAMIEGDNNFRKWYLLIGSKYYENNYFGKRFKEWIHDEIACEPSQNDSYGNGCLMRLSPIMYLKDRQKSQELVIESCLCSHSHPKSIIACSNLFMLYQSSRYRDKDWIKNIKINHNYLKFEKFEVSADKTMEFIRQCAFGSYSTQLSIEKTVKCSGDTDTNASILGELHNYLYQDITEKDAHYVECRLDSFLLKILFDFNEKF